MRLTFKNTHVKGLIQLFINQNILGYRSTQSMSVNLIAAQGLRVFTGVKKGFVITGPDRPACSVFDLLRIELAGFQVFHLNRVLPSAHGICAKSGQFIIFRNRISCLFKVGVPQGHLIVVKHNFFGRKHRIFTPAIQRIVFPHFKAGIIPVAVVFKRHTLIILLNSGFHLFKQLLLQRLGVRRHLLVVGIFSF